MKKIYLLVVTLIVTLSINAQNQSNRIIKILDAKENWFQLKNNQSTQPKEILESISDQLKLSEKDDVELIRSEEDQLGMKHYRYQQYHEGVKVEGAQLLLHIAEDRPVTVNGKLVRGINTVSQSQISEELALENALNFIDAEHYYWEDANAENYIKEIKNDQNASFFPTGELVFAERNYTQDGGQYQLNWKFDIYAIGEKQRTFVYVNALNGAISFSRSGIQSDASIGAALTRYSGEQQITTDSTGAANQGFILYDSERNIKTKNLEQGDDQFLAIEFTDDDNFWDNANDAMDDAAGDAHWGLEMSYDYFLINHGRDSHNGNGGLIRGFVHLGENFSNAFWDGFGVSFGDGNNNPLTSIDVVAHEFSHAVTQYTADLIYENESGALNESFSDVFGTAVEFYALDEDADWAMGLANFHFRDLDNPNNFNDPDTYHGDFWYYGSEDGGGVHTNSGVQNYWFYLLSEGGSGINDNETPFELDGIGITKAGEIAYRNLSVYLTPSSDYNDARLGSIAAAADLYGDCSEEVIQTIKAWYAVGLGNTTGFFDGELDIVLPESGCYLEMEEMELVFIYNSIFGCESVLSEGSVIKIGYSDNGGTPVLEEIVLTEDMEVWDELYYDGLIDLSEFGNHEIEVLFYVNDQLVDFLSPNQTKTINHTVTFESGSSVGFEDYDFSPDSFYVEIGSHAQAKITSLADNTGTKGYKMTGLDVDINAIDWPDNEDQNFTLNPEYNSKVCFCVDASDWNQVNLAFDLKQFHSEYWNELYGEDRPEFVSSLRLLVDGEQIGEQYHPTTYTDDPYLTHYVDLDQYAGSIFEACFESKNFIRNEEDPVSGSNGDNSYMDNIRFGYGFVGIDENKLASSSLSVYPNPSNGNMFIDFKDMDGDIQISIIDALGKVVFIDKNGLQNDAIYELDLSHLIKGIYVLKVKNDNKYITKRIILQ